MSTIRDDETVYEYYLRKKSDRSDWKVKLREDLAKAVDEGKNRIDYRTVFEGTDYEYNNDKQENEIIDSHLLDVIDYITMEGLKWYLGIRYANSAKTTIYDEGSAFIINW